MNGTHRKLTDAQVADILAWKPRREHNAQTPWRPLKWLASEANITVDWARALRYKFRDLGYTHKKKHLKDVGVMKHE